MRFRKEVQLESTGNEPFVSKRGQNINNKNKKPVRSSSEVNSLVNKAATSNSKLSWRPNQSINNLEQQKKQEVDKEIKEKTKLIKRRRNLKVTLRLVVFFLVLILIYFSLCFSSKRVNFSVDGLENGASYSESLGSAVNSAVGGGVIGNVQPAFYRYEKIEKTLTSSREDVDSIDLKFNLLKLRTDAKVHVNIPIIKWVSSDGKTSHVDQKGEIYSPPDELVKLFSPLEIGGTGLGAVSGSRIPVSPDKLAWIVKLVPQLRQGGVEPSKVNVVAESLKGVEVLLVGKDTRLLFSTDEDPVRSGVAAAKSVKYLEQSRAGGLAGLSYIDVRTPERVLYK
jgi:hypothetical protein